MMSRLRFQTGDNDLTFLFAITSRANLDLIPPLTGYTTRDLPEGTKKPDGEVNHATLNNAGIKNASGLSLDQLN